VDVVEDEEGGFGLGSEECLEVRFGFGDEGGSEGVAGDVVAGDWEGCGESFGKEGLGWTGE